MLRLNQLIRATPRPVVLRAAMQCRVQITRLIEDVDDFGNVVKECAALVRATDGDRFCTVMFYEPQKANLSDSKAWVHCSCPFFTFNVEVTNALKKSSDVINSNGELPMIRNPRMIPHLCKHLIALSRMAIRAKYKPTKNLMKKAPAENVPPAKVLRKPGEKAQPTNKVGVQPPKRPNARPLGGPKSVKPVAGPRRPLGR